MLTELKLSNFRIFNDQVTVRFKPITILIGRNSSGKSSVIKFLLMLQQSFEPGRSNFFTTDGEKVNLGTFAELKNKLTRKRNLEFQLTAKDWAEKPDQPFLDYLELADISFTGKFLYTVGASIRYSKSNTSGRSIYKFEDEASGKRLFSLTRQILDDSILWQYPQPVRLRMPTADRLDSETPLDNVEKLRTDWEEEDARFAQWIGEFALLNLMRHEVDSIRHIAPVRDESQRVIVTGSRPLDSVGRSGQFALPHLLEMINTRRQLYEFIRPHLQRIAGIDGINFRGSDYVNQAIARNSTTGANVLVADFGFGVSQCLPIFIQGAIMAPHTTLMVEQPEAQLHPSAQLELGEFFADLWKKRNVASIIETHSDNILLRIRRLVAKGDLSPEHVSVAYFTVKEENGKKIPTIKNLEINEDGSMEAGLPMEFFGENIIEGLKLGART